ncbi:MAG: hypothetical protein AAF638_08570 [Pseudomonadota bacterium]
MFKTLLRWIGLWFLAGAFVALAIDAMGWLANGTPDFRSLGAFWFQVDKAGLNIAQAAIERHVSPIVWDPVMIWVLNLPLWLVAGLFGLGLSYLGRRKRRSDMAFATS